MLASILNFVLSPIGFLAFAALVLLIVTLYSDDLKRRWFERAERKKWEHWNRPKKSEKPRK